MNRNIGLILGLAIAMPLLLIWPLPHTIALRHSLLFIALMWALGTRFSLRSLSGVSVVIGCWLALGVWAVISALLFTPFFTWKEFDNQILIATLAGFFGLALGFLLQREKRFALGWALLMVALLVHQAATAWTGLSPLWESGMIARRVGGLTEGPDKSNYLTVIVICWLLTETWLWWQGRKFSAFPAPALFALGALAGFVFYLEMIRNGLLSLGAAVAALFALSASHKGLFRLRRTYFMVMAVVFIFATLVASDPRWRGTWDAIHTAWNADTRAIVLGKDLPTDSADISAFLRLAMIKEGLALVVAHPLGIGFHRNAFGHGLAQTYGSGSGHSHSSLLDLTIGMGIPGLVMIVLFFCLLMRQGWRAEMKFEDGRGVLLLLLAAATLARAIVDSCLRDHMLQMDLFFFGVLLGALGQSGAKGAK